jgi:glutathione reductase (NADPH)
LEAHARKARRLSATSSSDSLDRKPPRSSPDGYSDWFTARQAAEPVYGFKVLVDEDSDKILGAHLVGPHADEVINLFALALRHGLTAEALKETMFAYPTGASDIGYML